MENQSLKLYEGMFVFPQTYVREDNERAFADIRAIFEKHGAKDVHMEVWSERNLAYEINHVRAASYILTYFEAESSAIAKIEREVALSDNILRCLLLKPDSRFDLQDYLANRKSDDKKAVEAATVVEESIEDVSLDEVKA